MGKKIIQILLAVIIGVVVFKLVFWIMAGVVGLVKFAITLAIMGLFIFLGYKLVNKYWK